MAADTREEASPQRVETQASEIATSSNNLKVYETFNAPPENANAIPGGAANTAGGRPQDVGLTEAAKTIRLEDFKSIHKLPCVRDALLAGIGSGFGMGGVRAILGASIPKASNWAVGTFCLASLGMYEFCQIRRGMEKKGMKRAVEIMDQKKMEREDKMKASREARRKAKEEADRLAEEEEEAKKKNNWKFW
ncbi:MAG: hypothetical protein M1827_000207 [Pycnora praestabilis]|nr:MAG: hypothetical protein M1827_000207 [Pycnora praestabilis]